ncbi:hypothetical protein D6D21_05681 [Aureobasidium pullulans]|uniref:Prolyl 4-hydroxylase alpha subunit Fe(2+) 2OG dioxygenase domain-containing protein n=1 Tax=Aureobasidium pullulans TaxID=5580 RepID=A0AB74IW36_AURPU|nr:hypothetical protein D6D21_05681 [Aureobasidium pullulans]
MAATASNPPAMPVAGDDYLAKEIEMLSTDLREEFRTYLDEITAAGQFATMRKLETIVKPEVKLLGMEGAPDREIATPLGSRDASKLIEAAHQAPFGRGEETIVDTSVRKTFANVTAYFSTWELSPDRFSLSEHWQPYVDSLMALVCDELGVSGDGIRAELYKMLLYEKGAMFKRHADSEKVPGMFGTLVISLPSAHWGGAVVVAHNGKKYSLQTYNHEYLAWYSDVIHEVQEVTSGYRWVLTYNLVQTDFEQFNSAASADRKLRAILTEWNNTIEEEGGETDKTIYQLDHKYTDASIRLNSLKGADLLRAQRLFSVCDQVGFTLYLASLEKQVHGSAESNNNGYYDRYDDDEEGSDGEFHAIEDVIDETLKLTRVVDTDGNVIATDLDIEEDDIVQPDPYEDRDPDEDSYEGWTGNAGATSTHWYKDSVLVLVPNDMIANVFLGSYRDFGYGDGGDAKVLAIFRHLVKRAQGFPGAQGDSLRQSVRQVGIMISDNRIDAKHAGMRSYKYTDTTVSEAIVACADCGQVDVLRNLSSAFRDNLSEGALKSLSDLRGRTDLSIAEDRTRLEYIFGQVVLNYKTVSKKYETLSSLIGVEASTVANHEDCMPEIKNWVVQMLAKIFSDLDVLSNEDGDVIAKIATLDTSEALLRDRIIPSIQRQMQGTSPDKTTFMMKFLSQALDSSKPLTAELVSIYEPLMEPVVRNLSFRKAQAPPPARTASIYDRSGANTVQQDPRKPALDGRVLLSILEHCRNLDLHQNALLLETNVAAQTLTMDPQDFAKTLMPFLKGIMERLRDGKDDIIRHQVLFRTGLSQYILRFVGQEPVPINWSRTPVRCNCADCKTLNNFLRSPVDRVSRMSVGKQRRHHLHIQLDAHTDCTHLTDRGYMETLVIIKQGKSFEDKFNAWKLKADLATAALRSLEDLEGPANLESHLKKLLGDQYEEIMTLKRVRIMTAAQQPSARQPQTNVASSGTSGAITAGVSTLGARQPHPSQVIGQKRKAVVIDLTDD